MPSAPKAVDVVRSHTERLVSCGHAEQWPTMCACDSQPDCDFITFLNHVSYGCLHIGHRLANNSNEVLETLSPFSLTRVRLMRPSPKQVYGRARRDCHRTPHRTRPIVVYEE